MKGSEGMAALEAENGNLELQNQSAGEEAGGEKES